MFKDSDVKLWLDDFGESTKAIIQLAMSKEEWPVDGDPDVQEALNKFSEQLVWEPEKEPHQLNDEEMDKQIDSLKAHRERLGLLPPVLLMELQAQFSFPRGIKLFGDTCQIHPELAKRMLLASGFGDEEVSVAKDCLVKRLMLLARMQIIKKVFGSEERLQLVIDVLKDYYAENTKGVEGENN